MRKTLAIFLTMVFAAVSCSKDSSSLDVVTGEATLLKSNVVRLTGLVNEDRSDFSSYGFYYGEKKDSLKTISGSTDWGDDCFFSDTLSALKYNTTYWYTAYAKSGDNTTRGKVASFTTGPYTFEAVDLGLSVKWGNGNVGADADDCPGDYYTWADASAASASLGDGWRVPTADEFRELMSKCKWTWTTRNGRKGYTITADNGNSIFLPAGGYKQGGNTHGSTAVGWYWTSDTNAGYGLCIRMDSADTDNRINSAYNYQEMSVRAVR